MKREWIKRTAVLTVLILSATLARMISEKAGTQADPWVILGKVGMIAGATSVIYFVAFACADLMMDGWGGKRLKLPKPTVGKMTMVMIAAINGTMLCAILGGFGQ